MKIIGWSQILLKIFVQWNSPQNVHFQRNTPWDYMFLQHWRSGVCLIIKQGGHKNIAEVLSLIHNLPISKERVTSYFCLMYSYIILMSIKCKRWRLIFLFKRTGCSWWIMILDSKELMIIFQFSHMGFQWYSVRVLQRSWLVVINFIVAKQMFRLINCKCIIITTFKMIYCKWHTRGWKYNVLYRLSYSIFTFQHFG